MLAAEDLATPDEVDQVMTILETTSWILPIKEIREERNKLYPILNLTQPTPVEPKPKPEDAKKKEEKESYGDLVREMGY
jgi:hypothetical protein